MPEGARRGLQDDIQPLLYEANIAGLTGDARRSWETIMVSDFWGDSLPQYTLPWNRIQVVDLSTLDGGLDLRRTCFPSAAVFELCYFNNPRGGVKTGSRTCPTSCPSSWASGLLLIAFRTQDRITVSWPKSEASAWR